MTSCREPAVAGSFYPADPAVLRQDVEALLRAAPAPDCGRPKAMIVPHAGYRYSGAAAAAAFSALRAASADIERVVLLGPAHRVWLDGLALPSARAFATPLGEVPVDTAAGDRIRGLPGVRVCDAAHAQEHALEVQLPFLQVALGDFRVLPLVVGQCPPDTVARVLDELWGGAETLIVVSSDLSHFHAYAEAQRIDARTSQRILGRCTDLAGEEACGAAAVNGLLACRGAGRCAIEQVALCNSGDTAGDRSRVVGYGAYVLH